LKVEVLQNGGVVSTHEVGEGSHKIGRGDECEIQLKSSRVSKQHALLVVKGSKAAIVDTGSSNGVFVNGVLVRKQRVDPGDDINIVDFRLRLVPPGAPERKSSRSPDRGTNSNGNLAFAAQQNAQAQPEDLSPQEKLLKVVDEKVLLPFYGMMKRFDWRSVLAMILMGTLVLSALLSVIPILRWGNQVTKKQALARAHTIIGQAVRENYRILAKSNDVTRLTVEAAESEEGMLAVYVIDPKTDGILAPAKYFNKTVNDPDSLLAIKKIIDNKEENVSVEVNDNTYVVAQPIYLFSQDANDRLLQAIVIGTFQITNGITATYEPMVEAALFALLMSLLAFFLIYKMMTWPIVQMQEQLDSALKGENVTITAEAKFPELEALATVMNFSVSRLREAGGGQIAAPTAAGDSDAEDADFVLAVQEFEAGSSDGLLLLDREKKVRYVGKILEELISLRNQYAQGQNISDACRDQSFAGTAIDLADKVMSSLGENQQAMLEVNGIARNLFAVGHKNKQGDIRFVLLTVKLGA
jgi:hypothetical protein